MDKRITNTLNSFRKRVKSFNSINIALVMISIVLLIILSIIFISIWNYGFDPLKIGPTLTALGSITAALTAIFAALWSSQKSTEAIQEGLKNSLKGKVFEYEYKTYQKLYSKVDELVKQTNQLLARGKMKERINLGGKLVGFDYFLAKKSTLEPKIEEARVFLADNMFIHPDIHLAAYDLLQVIYEIAKSTDSKSLYETINGLGIKMALATPEKLGLWQARILDLRLTLKVTIISRLNVYNLSDENANLYRDQVLREKRLEKIMEDHLREAQQ